jgi:hypothetical protein
VKISNFKESSYFRRLQMGNWAASGINLSHAIAIGFVSTNTFLTNLLAWSDGLIES